MNLGRKNTDLFQEGHVWKEKISDAHIMLGRRVGNSVPCYLVYIEQNHGQTSYKKGDFWCDAHPSALFDKFIKIL